MKQREILTSLNRESMLFLAECRDVTTHMKRTIREQQEIILNTFKHFDVYDAQCQRKLKRPPMCEKLRQLFSSINAAMPLESPEGKAQMSFAQMEYVTRATFADHYTFLAIGQIQSSLHRQLTTVVLKPVSIFLNALHAAAEDSDLAQSTIERAADAMQSGTAVEVPAEDLGRYQMLIRERATGNCHAEQLFDLCRRSFEQIIDRRMALMERYKTHFAQKTLRRHKDFLHQEIVRSHIQRQYDIVAALDPDEEILMVDKQIIHMKQFCEHFAVVFLPPEGVEMLTKVPLGNFNKQGHRVFKEMSTEVVRQDFLQLLHQTYPWIPVTDYRNCALALQRATNEQPDDIFGTVECYAKMNKKEQKAVREVICIWLQILIETPWEDLEEATPPQRQSMTA